jgi:hypothetical protein
VSDQDFFFDEDEAPSKEADAKGKPAQTETVKKSGTTRTTTSPAGVGAQQSVSMTVAALIGVISLLAGVIVGIVLPVGGPSVPPPGPGATVPADPGGMGGQAPQLSPDQLDQDLPPGHPPIGGGEAPGGAPGAGEGEQSEETTSN